jgi:hypothetical protein
MCKKKPNRGLFPSICSRSTPTQQSDPKKNPVLLGPTLIHKHKDEEAFSYLRSCLLRLKPTLAQLLAVGCNRDKALKNRLSSSFPSAVFLACRKQFEDDIKRKLTELGIYWRERNEILADIVGSDVTTERGLIDRSSGIKFDQDLKDLKELWDTREMKARNTHSPVFHRWFTRYQATDAKAMLLYPIRRDMGLGYDFYYNNDAESMHRNIKIRQNYKASEMSTVIDNIRREKDTNLSSIEDAIIDKGPYELAPQALHFKVDEHIWTYKWSPARRLRHLKKFHQALWISSDSSIQPSINSCTIPSTSTQQIITTLMKTSREMLLTT